MANRRCSIAEDLQIVEADISAYESLKTFHYRGDGQLGPYKRIYAIKGKRSRKAGYFGEYVGVIIYAPPMMNLQLRNIATNNRYRVGGDKSAYMNAINRDFLSITRVIIEPRFRGLGVASWLVRETLTRCGAAMVESLAAMGHINPFFEKAGMRKYTAPLPVRCVRMQQALSWVGLEGDILLDPGAVQREIERMNLVSRSFIEIEFKRFLQAYGSGARIRQGLPRIKYVLSRLTSRPAYYLWQRIL